MESSFSAQLEYAINTLTSPAGAIGLVGWLALLLMLVFNQKVKWVVLVGLFWVATLSFYVKESVLVRLAFPLEQIRSYGRPLCIGLLVALAIPAILASRGWRMRVISVPLLLFFFLEMILGMRIAMAGVTDRGIVTMAIYPLMFICLGWGLSKWVHSWEDAHRVLRCIVIAGAVFVVGNVYQLLINRSAVLRGGRLMGASGNPQHAAVILALAIPVTCYFIARAKENKLLRIGCAILTGFLCIFLVWTGSRTGILMAAVGVAVTFFARLGRLFGVAIFAGIFVMAVVQIYAESTAAIDEMYTRGDTRTRVWADMFESFMSEPMIGSMSGHYGVGENSYLSILANTGLLGGLPLALFLIATAWTFWKLIRVRKYLGGEKQFVDMIFGGMAGLFAGAMFEGFFLGTLTLPVFVMYCYLQLIPWVFDAVEMEQHQRAMAGMLTEDLQHSEDEIYIPPSGQQYAETRF